MELKQYKLLLEAILSYYKRDPQNNPERTWKADKTGKQQQYDTWEEEAMVDKKKEPDKPKK